MVRRATRFYDIASWPEPSVREVTELIWNKIFIALNYRCNLYNHIHRNGGARPETAENRSPWKCSLELSVQFWEIKKEADHFNLTHLRCEIINLELQPNAQHKCVFQCRWPPRQGLTEALDRPPLQLAFYPFQFSWLGYLESLGSLFILIDTYWIHEKRIQWRRNKSWILSGSFHTSEESQPAEEKSFHSYESLFGDFVCFHLESELSVDNNMSFLLRCSENISFWLHMLTFSVLKMWVSKCPFRFLLQEGLSHSPEKLFICRHTHSLEFLEGQTWGGCCLLSVGWVHDQLCIWHVRGNGNDCDQALPLRPVQPYSTGTVLYLFCWRLNLCFLLSKSWFVFVMKY